MSLLLTTFLLFILPFIVVPIGNLPFESSKVILAEIGIESLLITAFLRKQLSKEVFKNPLFYLLAGLFILTLYNLLLDGTSTTLFGNPFRLQGVFLDWHLFVFCLLMSQIRVIKQSTTFYLAVLLVLFAATIILGADQNGRAVATLGEANSLAAVAIFLWPFLWFTCSIPNIWQKLIKAVSIIIPMVVIFLSGSRSGVLAFILQTAFLIASTKFRLPLGKMVPLFLLLVAISLSLPFIEGGGEFQNREQIWKTALVAGSIKPILGNGFGNIEQVLPQASRLINNNVQYEYVDSSHNLFLDFWVQGGFFGLLSLILLIFQTFKTFVSQSKTLEAMVLLGLIETMMFNPSSVAVLIYFWFLLGRGFAVTPLLTSESEVNKIANQ